MLIQWIAAEISHTEKKLVVTKVGMGRRLYSQHVGVQNVN